MRNILMAATPLAGHVNPMLIVAEHLVGLGHQISFLTSENFRSQVEDAGAAFHCLPGIANYDYRKIEEAVPELLTIRDPIDQMNTYVHRLFADRIADQYQGIRKVLAEGAIDIILPEIAFFGVLPLLLEEKPRPAIYSCGVTAPVYHDP